MLNTSICCLSSSSDISHFFLVWETELSVLFLTYLASMFVLAFSSCKRSFKWAINSFLFWISTSLSTLISTRNFWRSLIVFRLSSSLFMICWNSILVFFSLRTVDFRVSIVFDSTSGIRRVRMFSKKSLTKIKNIKFVLQNAFLTKILVNITYRVQFCQRYRLRADFASWHVQFRE